MQISNDFHHTTHFAMCFSWLITIELLLLLELANLASCHQGGGHRGGGGHWGGGSHNNNHHHGRNPGFGWNSGGIYPNNFGNDGAGWNSPPLQIHSPNNNYGQYEVTTPSVPTECPRPIFTDDVAKLVIEKCDTDNDSRHQRSCWDSSKGIPIGWKVFMTCTKGNIRIKQPSTCSSSGTWTTTFPQDCVPLYEKYATISQLDIFQKIPLNNQHHPITSTLRTTSTTEDDVEFHDIDNVDIVVVPSIKNHEKQCPMLKMQLSDNFIFSCFLHHGSPAETRGCITSYAKVSSGTIAILKCKPPFYNKEGAYSQWLCEDGFWSGDFDNKLKCLYSKIPVKTRPRPTTARVTTTTPRPRLSSTTTTMRAISSTPPAYGWNIPIPISSPTISYDTQFLHSSTTHQPQRSSTTTTTTSRPWRTTARTTTTTFKTRPLRPVLDPEITGIDTSDDNYDYDDYDVKPEFSSTSSTTNEPTSATTSSTPSPTFSSEKVVCPPLKPRSEGMILECVSKTKTTPTTSEQVFVNGCDIPQPVGAEAKYSCRQYYESTAALINIYRKCKEDGTWTGSADSFSCVPECGGKNEVFVPYITSGTPAFKGEWPWHAALFQKNAEISGPPWEYICGGTLISRKTIITAAHCVTFHESSTQRNESTFRFDLGRFELEKVDDLIQTKEVQSIHTHPSYSPFGYDSDIAIIILKESVGIGYHVRPICFPQSLNTAQEELMLDEGSMGTVVGWGKTEMDKLSEKLHTAQLKVVSQKECSAGTRGAGGGRLQIKSTTYCAAPSVLQNDTSKFVNVCNGDSGGGMYFPQTTSDSATTRWYLQGIVSVGIGDENNRCQPNQFSFFTRVGRYADWLVRVMSEHDAL